jgi:Family of unknown function (DUF5372)
LPEREFRNAPRSPTQSTPDLRSISAVEIQAREPSGEFIDEPAYATLGLTGSKTTDQTLWPGLSTTAHRDSADGTFEIVHPHHPLRGQRFQLVTYRHNWGEDRVYFHDSNGVLRSIPASWTTVLTADPFVVVAAGRCLFRYDDLLKLADLMEKGR